MFANAAELLEYCVPHRDREPEWEIMRRYVHWISSRSTTHYLLRCVPGSTGDARECYLAAIELHKL